MCSKDDRTSNSQSRFILNQIKWACKYLTISPPCTPLPLRLGAYSARSTERNHSITRWLVHWVTSEGVTLFCKQEEQAGKEASKHRCPSPSLSFDKPLSFFMHMIPPCSWERKKKRSPLSLDCYLAAIGSGPNLIHSSSTERLQSRCKWHFHQKSCISALHTVYSTLSSPLSFLSWFFT